MRAKVAVAIVAIGAGLACAAMLYSANEPATNTNTNNTMQQQTQQVQMIRVRDLLGCQVINPQSEDLGKIEDIVFNAETGKIGYGILGHGGVMGVGTKYLPTPWTTLRLVLKGTKTANGTMAAHDYFVLELSKDALRNAPTFDNDHWPNFADNNYVDTIDRFYSEQRRRNNPAP